MEVELFSSQFFVALFSIIILDLVLAGDNAVVIAMASNRLAEHLRKRAIYVGTAGAIVIRLAMTFFAVQLLTVPYLQAIGGLVLLPIAVRLMRPSASEEHVEAADTFAGAVKTIIVADAAMGIDNVIAIAGASHGDARPHHQHSDCRRRQPADRETHGEISRARCDRRCHPRLDGRHDDCA